MKSALVEEEIYAILQEMGLSKEAMTSKASFQKDLGLDSLDFAELVMKFELRFEVEFPILEMEGITTLHTAICYLTRQLSSKL